jgi:hemerythrin-like domain-containing protein
MMSITEALVTEHGVFFSLFGQIERVLPKLETLAEVKVLTSLVEGLLQDHGETETNLAYHALDHVLADRGELDHMYRDHQEIDAGLKRALAAGDPAEARRLLEAALRASREHFRLEERLVFPLIEKVLQRETLGELGRAWTERHATRAS